MISASFSCWSFCKCSNNFQMDEWWLTINFLNLECQPSTKLFVLCILFKTGRKHSIIVMDVLVQLIFAYLCQDVLWYILFLYTMRSWMFPWFCSIRWSNTSSRSLIGINGNRWFDEYQSGSLHFHFNSVLVRDLPHDAISSAQSETNNPSREYQEMCCMALIEVIIFFIF